MYSLTVMMGRMVADPELRQTPNGVSVATFRIAVDRPYKRDGKSIADFFDVVAWRGTAEFISKHFKKGKPILIQGHMESRSWDDQNGIKRYRTELITDSVFFCGDHSSGRTSTPLPDEPPVSEPVSPAYSNNSPDFQEIPMDDDLPF